jgi:hypothetical protein
MYRRSKLIVGGGFVLISVFLEAVELFKVIRELIPEGLAGKISQLDVLLILFIGIMFIWLGKTADKEGSDSPSSIANTNSVGNATATATGNKVETHFHFDGVSTDDLAKAIAKELKTGNTSGVSAEDEADATTSPRLVATDGFVQLENIELQVTSVVLEAGQTLRAKYFYANRGVLPVYEVQSWGLIQVLDPTLNPGPRLKAVMKAAARDGRNKFPGTGSLGVQRTNHAFAQLSEPFTKDQIEALGNKSAMLFLLIGGVWVDNLGEAHYWAVCQQAEFLAGLTWENYAWRDL